jgi:hypothetical protein
MLRLPSIADLGRPRSDLRDIMTMNPDRTRMVLQHCKAQSKVLKDGLQDIISIRMSSSTIYIREWHIVRSGLVVGCFSLSTLYIEHVMHYAGSATSRATMFYKDLLLILQPTPISWDFIIRAIVRKVPMLITSLSCQRYPLTIRSRKQGKKRDHSQNRE